MFNLTNIITPVTNIISICFFYITVILTTPTSIFIFLIIVTAIIQTIRFNFLLTTLFIRIRLKVSLLARCHEWNWAVKVGMRLMYIKLVLQGFGSRPLVLLISACLPFICHTHVARWIKSAFGIFIRSLSVWCGQVDEMIRLCMKVKLLHHEAYNYLTSPIYDTQNDLGVSLSNL